jgi:hypothetical protein
MLTGTMSINVALSQADLVHERAAQLPMLSEWRANVADLLLKEGGYFTVIRRMTAPLAEEMAISHGDRLDTAIRQIQNIHKADGQEINTLLHSIPRAVLASILMGTVAYDQTNKDLVQYDADGSGVYVVGISLSAHNGAFLTGNEMASFVNDLERYITEAEVCLGVDDDPIPPRSRFIIDADNQYGIYAEAVPRFIRGARSLNSMRQFLASMKRRRDAMQKADASGTRRSHQSPLYVGCAVNMKRRLMAYGSKQYKSTFEAVNNPFGLTMSLLHMAGLAPKEQFVSVIRTWQPGQLGAAEGLVAALAGSYIEQQGFNVQVCGQHRQEQGVSSDADATTYVLLTSPHLTENVEASARAVATLQGMAQTVDDTDAQLAQLDGMGIDDMLQRIEQQKAACNRLTSRVHELQTFAARTMLDEQVQMLEDECEEARNRRRLIEEIRQVHAQLAEDGLVNLE